MHHPNHLYGVRRLQPLVTTPEHRARYDLDAFATHARLSDELITKASKEQLAEATRLLALNIGWYHQRYGDVPQDLLLGVVRTETLDEDGKRLPLHGMQSLASAPAEVMGVGEDAEEEVRH